MKKTRTVICFCKYPEPGMVKSRLAADLNPERAAFIYRVILENILQKLCTVNCEVALYCYPDSKHTFFVNCKDQYKVSLHKQRGCDLGMRMYNAINDVLTHQPQLVLIGSDCLELDAGYINAAFAALNSGNDLVLGPTCDGGYALIGANKIDASIFKDMTWSTPQVLQTTKTRIDDLNWQYTELPLVRDIDTLSDYEYFSEHDNFKHLF
ncbi:MAG: TIGR04282 family arsenosugar biosynthesis glycosyltransferase [Gammaproteobacteria bacterium]|nr:TIGR04282 family arsenosugar biosynthesis glycosyltransferase [Gammaproteobacteria bacterium]